MKKIVRTCTFLVLLLAVFWSCKKSFDEVAPNTKGVASGTNQELIRKLKAGEIKSNRSGLLSRTPFGEGYDVELIVDRLAFDSWNGVSNFLVALDQVKAEWNSALDPELLGESDDEKFLAGDAATNAFDDEMGFFSLRRKYIYSFYDDNEFRRSLQINVTSQDWATIFNQYHEVQVADTIYKLLKDGFIAALPTSKASLLPQLREQGFSLDDESISWYDFETREKVLRPQRTNGCNLTFSYIKYEQSNAPNWRQVNLKVAVSGTCLLYYDIDWGDGFSSNKTGTATETFTHTYNTNPGTGNCTQYTIKVKATVAFNCNDFQGNSCPVGTKIEETKAVSVCEPIPGCSGRSSITQATPLTFTQWGGTYYLEGKIEADTRQVWFDDRKIVGDSRLHVWRNGKWRQYRSRHVHLGVIIGNVYYTNNCTTPNPFSDPNFRSNRDDIDVKRRLREDFQWTTISPNNLVSNHYVHFIASDGTMTTHSILNNALK